MTLSQRFLPHPILSCVVTLVWLLLVNEFTLGQFLLGAIMGWVIPLVTSVYWPDKPRIRNPRAIFGYVAIVLWDILVSNVQVAYLILFKPSGRLRSQFVTVPLDLRTAEAIATLAGTITLTPGTVSADLSADGRALLVHCLDTADPAETVTQIKTRYESRLKEIFES